MCMHACAGMSCWCTSMRSGVCVQYMPDIVTAYNLLMAHDELASKLRAKKSELAAVKAGGEGVEQSEAYNQILTSMREPLREAMRVLQQRIDKARSNPGPLVAQGVDVGGYIAYNEHILQANEKEMQSLAQEAQKKVGAHALITAMGAPISAFSRYMRLT